MPTVAWQIKVRIEEYACNPQENDIDKVVAEVREIATKDMREALKECRVNLEILYRAGNLPKSVLLVKVEQALAKAEEK